MSTISASTTSTTGFKVTSDTTGTLVFQTGASPTTAMSISSSQIISFTNPPTATGAGSVATNTAFGTSALAANTTGSSNTGFGYQAGTSITTGTRNTAIGKGALATNSTGGLNTAVGEGSLNQNTAGNNTAVGVNSLLSNTSGSENTAVGRSAASVNTTGTALVAMGYGALDSNTSGSYNTAIGMTALTSNTTASKNTVVGYQAGYTNTTSNYNTFVGAGAGYTSNATGTTSAANTCIGHESGYSMSSGAGNCFVGPGNGSISNAAGYAMTTGNNNTILGGFTGNQGGLDIRTSSNYIVLSDGAGNPAMYWTGSQLWKINSASGFRYCELDFAIGGVSKSSLYWDNTNTNLYVVNASGGVYLTNTGTSWASNSDERLKENLTPIENGLSKVCSLRSVIGNFIADETKKATPFLIAQDVQAVLPEAVTTSTLKGDETNTEYLGVAYTEVIPLLVAAIKEQQALITTLTERIAALENK